jgi:hypothetical protein
MSSGLLIEEICEGQPDQRRGPLCFQPGALKIMVHTQVHDFYVLLIQAPYSAGKVLEER